MRSLKILSLFFLAALLWGCPGSEDDERDYEIPEDSVVVE